MTDLVAIERTIGQVRSEMRVAVARGLPRVSLIEMDPDLERLGRAIGRFQGRLRGEYRNEPKARRVCRELQRLVLDLVEFFTPKGDDPVSKADDLDGQLVVRPVSDLSSLLSKRTNL